MRGAKKTEGNPDIPVLCNGDKSQGKPQVGLHTRKRSKLLMKALIVLCCCFCLCVIIVDVALIAVDPPCEQWEITLDVYNTYWPIPDVKDGKTFSWELVSLREATIAVNSMGNHLGITYDDDMKSYDVFNNDLHKIVHTSNGQLLMERSKDVITIDGTLFPIRNYNETADRNLNLALTKPRSGSAAAHIASTCPNKLSWIYIIHAVLNVLPLIAVTVYCVYKKYLGWRCWDVLLAIPSRVVQQVTDSRVRYSSPHDRDTQCNIEDPASQASTETTNSAGGASMTTRYP